MSGLALVIVASGVVLVGLIVFAMWLDMRDDRRNP